MTKLYRIDNFGIGAELTIHRVVGMERVILKQLTNSAAYISIGGTLTTVSCGTECYPYVEIEKPITSETQEIVDVKKRDKNNKTKEADKVLNKFKFPKKPFTIKQIADKTGLDYLSVSNWCKGKLKEVGVEKKKKGKKGKLAKLYVIL